MSSPVDPAEQLKRQNQILHEQIKSLFRNEERLHRVQAGLDRHVRRIQHLNEFVFEVTGDRDVPARILERTLDLLLELFVFDDAIGFHVENRGGQSHALPSAIRREDGTSTLDPAPAPTPLLAELDNAVSVVSSDTTCEFERTILDVAERNLGGPAEQLLLLAFHCSDGAPIGYVMARISHLSHVLPHQALPDEASRTFLELLTRHVERALENSILHRRARETQASLEAQATDLTAANEALRSSLEDLATSERHLARKGRMEALGRLAGGIAHDFNNLLVVIMGNADLIAEDDEVPDFVRPQLEMIQTAGGRAKELTQKLLAFGRVQDRQPTHVSLNDVINETFDMLRPTIGEDVVLERDLDADLGTCLVDPAEIGRILLNLAVNARDAMPAGGALSIRTANVRSEAGEAQIELRVIDTGTGMDEATLAQVFDPFFSTKGVGNGTGMGLAMTYGVIERSLGTTRLESQLGEGTQVIIRLPRSYGEPAIAEPGFVESSSTDQGQRVLVVEDEQMVRNLVQDILERGGFEVLTAPDGEQALAILQAESRSIDLLLTDVVMPGMTGVELARQVRTSWPETPILYMSGYTNRALRESDPDADLLRKPFTVSELLQRVRAALRCS